MGQISNANYLINQNNKKSETNNRAGDSLLCADFFNTKINSNNKGNLYIIHNDKRYNVKSNLYLENDIVEYKIINDKILINKIIDRSKTNLVCTVEVKSGTINFIPLFTNKSFPIEINSNDFKYVVDGDRILLSVDKELSNNKYKTNLVKVICNKKDMDATIKTVCEANGFSTKFPVKVEEELKNIPYKVTKREIISRKDERMIPYFTIDGSDTKDRDDAIHIEKEENGNYIIRVAISHVSNYVKPGTAIFEEAIKRGTSVYTPGAVNPQLPSIITNGICSLNENVERLTKTTRIRIDKEGNILNYKVYNSVIKSRKAFNYDEVNKYFTTNKITSTKDSLKRKLDLCKEINNILNNKKRQRGYLHLETDQLKYETDINSNISKIESVETGISQEIIENFMVLANNVVTYDLQKKNLDLIYRNHSIANTTKLEQALDKIKELDLIDKETLKKSKTIQSFLEKIPKDIKGQIISRFILTSLPKASYSNKNIGHYGLGLDSYTHSTSPIRRGCDLIIQTIYDLYDNNVEYDKQTQKQLLEEYANTFSIQERSATKVEHQASSLKTYDYLVKNKITSLNMTIIDINSKYMILKTDNFPEGILELNEIETGYTYVKEKNTIKINNDKVYKIGSTINVSPSDVSSLGIMYTNNKSKKKYKSNIKTKQMTIH